MTSLPSNRDKELELEVENINTCWDQGQSAFLEGQESARKIFMLLKMKHESSLSTKEITKKMMNLLGHLNGISAYKIKNLLELF